MQRLVEWLVGQPITVAVIALTVVLGTLLLARLRPRPLPRLVVAHALLWVAYAGWEALVHWRTPDADLRVDLLLLWPVLAITAVGALIAAARWLAVPAAPPPASTTAGPP